MGSYGSFRHSWLNDDRTQSRQGSRPLSPSCTPFAVHHPSKAPRLSRHFPPPHTDFEFHDKNRSEEILRKRLLELERPSPQHRRAGQSKMSNFPLAPTDKPLAAIRTKSERRHRY